MAYAYAQLNDVLSIEEMLEVKKHPYIKASTDTPIKDLTVEDLSHMGLMLMRKEYGEGSCPGGLIPAFAIGILIRRAQRKGIGVF